MSSTPSTSPDALFTPVTLGQLSLKNRLVMAPMTRSRADAAGVLGPLSALYYRQRASAGLIITEGTQPSAQGQGYSNTPGIHTAEQVRAWRAITDAVHQEGGLIALQIMHVGRVGHPLNQTLGPGGLVAPSALAARGEVFTAQGKLPMPTPQALTPEGIARVIDEHRLATTLAMEAGFDAVELHGANGYLSQQFLSTSSNLRDDDYGGSPQGRSRFVLETLQAMIQAAGPGRVGLRLSPGGTYNDIQESDPELTYPTLFELLAPLPLAYIHFQHTGWPQHTLYDRVPAPLILTGDYDAQRALDALAHTPARAIGFGRAFLANPDLPARLRAGHPLNEPHFPTFFSPGETPERGYTDYPTWSPA